MEMQILLKFDRNKTDFGVLICLSLPSPFSGKMTYCITSQEENISASGMFTRLIVC